MLIQIYILNGMHNITLYISEKLRINKDSINKKHNTENVLIFDDKIELSLFITGLNRISKDNNNCQDIVIFYIDQKYQEYYKFTKSPKQGSVVISRGDKQLSICEIVLYKIDKNEHTINYNVVDNVINELTEWNKTKKRKYLEILYSDDIPKTSKKHTYMWYSQTFNTIIIYTTNESYETLKEKNVFQ